MNKKQLFDYIKSKKSFLCVGLDPDLKKRIEKYDKIINEKEQEYKNYCSVLKFVNEYEPANNVERIMKKFIFIQNQMLIEATNR